MVSLNSVEVLLYEDHVATIKPDPVAFSIARILLAAALIGAPLAFGAVESGAWMSLVLVACLALFLWTLGSVQQSAVKFVWSPLYLPLALFLILGLVQYGARLTVDKWETRTALVLLAGDLTFFFLAAQLFGGANSDTRNRFGLAILFFAGALGLFSILQFASGAQEIYWTFDTGGSNFFGPYGNPDHYAGLMEMLIPFGIFYVAEHRGVTTALALPVLGVTIAVASLLLAGSRGGLLALSVEILIVIALACLCARGRERRGLLAVGFAILVAGLLFTWVDPGSVAKRLGTVASPGNAWAEWSSFRKSVTLDSLRMLRARPILGVGLGNFEIAYPQYQSFPTDLTVDYAHNDYAQAMAETGVVGAALILSALFFFFHLAFRGVGKRLRSPGSWLRLGAAVGCCGLLMHSFVDFNLHIPANAAWFAVLAGIATTDEQPLRHLTIATDRTA
jgi:O-antigen ligase